MQRSLFIQACAPTVAVGGAKCGGQTKNPVIKSPKLS